ncbi:hypothetical protein GCM10023328_24040 [Modestobacter marinus]|uniref:Capsular polysaccharide biosynthesis protein n=1 Tax=Modestobacter marinus TaxID=477641 RepID=A0A846LLZ1_9ACTN|nr:Wzz/FepE/Etk N-terminal domain-containing protein [Modestobacter marinus]NIH66338.1 capsular polysaccharide biosynthesis protein [Modestobacter marinus]GGL62857.1 hypothetical protein GCM10011589_18840 [Modestobacter marinus]
MVLHDYVGALRRGWWVVLTLALLGGAAGAALAYLAAPTYYAQTTVYVTTTSDNPDAMERAANYADLAETSAVLGRATAILGEPNQEELQEVVSAAARENSSMVDISASGTEASVAAARANAVAEALVNAVELLEVQEPAPAVGSPPALQLTIVEAAEAPDNATSPRPRNNVLVGVAVGLGVALLAIVVLGALDTRIRTASDAPRPTPLETITSIPTQPRHRTSRMAREEARREAFRALRTTLVVGAHARGPMAMLGATAESDVREAAGQLAAVLAELDCTVAVVDLDLHPSERGSHRPAEERAEAKPGVAELLTGATQLSDMLPQGGSGGPFVLGPGRVEATSPRLIGRPAMAELVQQLSARFDYVLLACPPLSERSESATVARLAGDCLLFVESGRTRRADYVSAVEKLAGSRVARVHLVVDHVRDPDLGYTRMAPELGATAAGSAR